MYNVVKQIKRTFTVFTALIITVITTRVRAASFKTCGPEELAQCAKSLSVLTDTNLNFVKSKEDLDKVCPDLDNSLSCINAYSRLCMNLQQRKHFRKLFHGTGSMVRELCRNGTYQDEFLSHAPCLQKAETAFCFNRYSEAMIQIQTATKQKELEEAAYRNNHHHHHHHHRNRSDETVFKYQKAKREAADEGLKNVCCSFQEYVDCSTQTVRKTCGDEAAHFSRGFLDKMASSMIKMHCMDYSPEDCREKGFHTEGYYYSNSNQMSSATALLGIIAFLSYFLR